MKQYINNQKVKAVLAAVKPWFSALLVVLVLKYTGALSQISQVAQTALMKSGAMDFTPGKNETRAAAFDYNFAVKNLDGKQIPFEEFKGKVVFLNLWATWCGPCRVEMPSIQSLYDRVKDKDIVFAMLSLDTPANEHKVIQYIRDKGFTFPVYTPVSFTNQLKVPSIPTTFVIGKDGKIRSKKVGTANYATEDFENYLLELAAE